MLSAVTRAVTLTRPSPGSLPAASACAYGLLDLSLGGHAEALEELPDLHVEGVFVHDFSPSGIQGGERRRIGQAEIMGHRVVGDAPAADVESGEKMRIVAERAGVALVGEHQHER